MSARTDRGAARPRVTEAQLARAARAAAALSTMLDALFDAEHDGGRYGGCYRPTTLATALAPLADDARRMAARLAEVVSE